MPLSVNDVDTKGTHYVEGEDGAAFVKVKNAAEDPVMVAIAAGGPVLSNVLLQDDDGVLFVATIDGEVITNFRVDTGAEFTPNAPITVAGVTGVNSADFGVKADAAASTDTGTFSLIALFKRLLQNITTLINFTGVDRVIASDGVLLPVASLAQTITFAGPGGARDTAAVSYLGEDYVQTLTYTASNVTGISRWIKQ